MEAARKTKRNLKRNLTRLKSQAEDILKLRTLDFKILSKLEALLADYKQHKVLFEQCVDEILTRLDEESSDFATTENNLMQELAEVSNVCFNIEAEIKDFHKKISSEEARSSLATPPQSFNQSFVVQEQPKLPKISLPTFDGKIENFNNYRKLFENLVHNSTTFTNVQKLHWLKESFEGDAKKLLRDFELDDRTYPEAWAYVLARYDSPRTVVKSHFRNLMDLKVIKSETEIRSLVDQVETTIRGLKAHGEKIDDTFSHFVTYWISTRLDNETARDWENSVVTQKEYPSYHQLQKFLQNRAFTVEFRKPEPKTTQQFKSNKTEPNTKSEKKSLTTVASKIKCVVCEEAHFLNQCPKFKKLKVLERYEMVKKNKLCINCFNPFHMTSDCPRSACQKCNQKHNIMLHREPTDYPSNRTSNTSSSTSSTNDSSGAVPEKNSVSNIGVAQETCASSVAKNKQTILATTVVNVILGNGRTILARVLLDGGSQTTLVSKSFLKRHKIKTYRTTNPVVLSGITNGQTVLDSSVDLLLKSRFSQYQIAINADVIERIPYAVSSNIEKIKANLPNLDFGETQLPYTEADILLGAEYFEFVVENHRIFVDDLAVRQTKFGYVISGAHKSSFLTSTQFVGVSKFEIDERLKRFWEFEELPAKDEVTDSEKSLVEEKFDKTFSINKDGQFVVSMLPKPEIKSLHGSFGTALKFLKRTERCSSPDMKIIYREFMNEYEQMGHMRKLRTEEIVDSDVYYIPHFLIHRPTSTTTQHRVVFNASIPDKSGYSLNDLLHVGPTLQPELFDTVIKFRSHRVAFVADIAKMYRNILVNPEERKYQRILWRNGTTEPISHYELNTVTYGTSSAPYLATKCLEMCARSIENSNPDAAQVIRSNFYMDDLITGADTVNDAVILQSVIHSTLASFSFNLRKYQSNSTGFLATINEDLIAKTNSLSENQPFVYVLGLIWCCDSDKLMVSLSSSKPTTEVITKRVILSEIAKIFDILGILCPVTVRAKMLLQDLWREELKWDDVISDELSASYENYRSDLNQIKDFAIDRLYSSIINIATYSIIGFCDASPKAYCAVVYLRSLDSCGYANVNIVSAKSRVAPLKADTIPRLELLAARLLAQLTSRIALNLNVSKNDMFLFSDSTVVLHWLKTPVCKLKQFVATRVRYISDIVNPSSWNYVSTKTNVADLGTRGLTADQFLQNRELWLHGPSALINDLESMTKVGLQLVSLEKLPELRKIKVEGTSSLLTISDTTLLKRFSSYNKLINVIAYMLRFYNIVARKQEKPNTLNLSVNEREKAITVAIKLSQFNSFPKDLDRFINKRRSSKGELLTAHKKSPLRSLDPFLDEKNVLRVGGRLKNSTFNYNKKHPIILSAKCEFVQLFITHLHEKHFHCTKNVIVTYLTATYWMVGGYNNVIKRIIRNCVFCRKLRAVTGQQIMGQLPYPRTMMSRPFTYVGVDFTGHFLVKCLKHRTTKHDKVYAAFFVCLSTRAVHIELVSELTTVMFIESLKRFISRRGKPKRIYSDNGKNFVGARNILVTQRQQLLQWTSKELIEWEFIIPRTPHQGGIWESAIKSGKSLTVRATRNCIFTFEQLLTVLAQVECILNSRPLCYQIRADQSYEVITPGHFLTGDHMMHSGLSDLDLDLGVRLEKLRIIINSFWRQWSKTYLNELQRRNKWKNVEPSLSVNDVVLIKEDNNPILSWSMGKIVQTLPDKEGIVRNYEVKTANGVLQRNITRLVKLCDTNDYKDL